VVILELAAFVELTVRDAKHFKVSKVWFEDRKKIVFYISTLYRRFGKAAV